MSKFLWFLFWPLSQLLFSPEDIGIEETQLGWRWPLLIIAACIALAVAAYYGIIPSIG